MTPTEDLFIEVLVARMRLGETLWTFDSMHKKTAKALESQGLVHWKSGIVENTILVWPQPVLRRPPYMSEDYHPPRERSLGRIAELQALGKLEKRGVITFDQGSSDMCCGIPRDDDGFCVHRPGHPIYVSVA